MKVKLIAEKVIASVASEEELADASMMDSFYEIRTLKALVESLIKGYVNVISKERSVYSKKYSITFPEGYYEILEVVKTSQEWEKTIPEKYKLIILDPDGWDRTNYEYSYNEELITRSEFMMRVMNSTIRFSQGLFNEKW